MRQDLTKLLSLFNKREKRRFGLQVLLMIVSSLFEVVGVGAIPLFIIFLASPEKLQHYSRAFSILNNVQALFGNNLLLAGTLCLGAFFLLKNLFLVYVSYLNADFLFSCKLALEKKLYNAYLNAPYLFHLKTNTSIFQASLNSEIRVVVISVLLPLFKMINYGLLMIAIVVLLLLTEPLISFIVFFILGSVIFFFLSKIRYKIRKYGQDEQQERAVMVKWINQTFGGIKDIRILAREAYFQSRFFESVDKTAQSGLFYQFIAGVPKPLVETVSVFSMLGIIIFLISQDRPIESIISVLVLFGAAFIRLMPAVQNLASSYALFKFSTYAIKPVYEDIAAWGNFKPKADAAQPMPLQKNVALKNVTFSYPGNANEVLNNINLEIKAGESVAFVGHSGSGKTTLVDVLMGLISPDTGEVLVDGKNIQPDRRGWHKNIGYVPQTIFLIDDSIRRNIAFGINDSEIDEVRIKEVLEEAQLTEFVSELPDGLDTQIGERGVRLSGGQRQRVGIARALYHNPQVLVLDEATSALDNLTEHYIIDAIDRFKRKRTVIMIAHRLSTVMKCDRLYFMSNGKIVNEGTFEYLRNTDSNFRKIAHV